MRASCGGARATVLRTGGAALPPRRAAPPPCRATKRDGWPTPYRSESAALLDALLTRQAVRTLVHYASETNGEIHLYLNNYLAEHPLLVDDKYSARAWLAELAAQPLTRVSDPGRSSAPSAAALAQVGASGEREVSPRDIVERVLALRLDIADEMADELGRAGVGNGEVLRATLARTLSEKPPLED